MARRGWEAPRSTGAHNFCVLSRLERVHEPVSSWHFGRVGGHAAASSALDTGVLAEMVPGAVVVDEGVDGVARVDVAFDVGLESVCGDDH